MYYKTIFNNLISTLKEHQGYGGYPYGGYGCGCNQGCGGYGGTGFGAAIVLVLFILLVIVLGARTFDGVR